MSIALIVDRLLGFYSLLVIAYVILSWFRPRGTLFEVYKAIGTVVEPYVGLFRRIVPTARVGDAGIDFSPLIAILLLDVVIRPVLRGLLVSLGL